jgi:hypothetical protein
MTAATLSVTVFVEPDMLRYNGSCRILILWQQFSQITHQQI